MNSQPFDNAVNSFTVTAFSRIRAVAHWYNAFLRRYICRTPNHVDWAQAEFFGMGQEVLCFRFVRRLCGRTCVHTACRRYLVNYWPISRRHAAPSRHARRQHTRRAVRSRQVYHWGQTVVPAEQSTAQPGQVRSSDRRNRQSAARGDVIRIICIQYPWPESICQ